MATPTKRVAFRRAINGESRWYVRHDGRFYRLDALAVASRYSRVYVVPRTGSTYTPDALILFSAPENVGANFIGTAHLVGSVYAYTPEVIDAELAEGIDRTHFTRSTR